MRKLIFAQCSSQLLASLFRGLTVSNEGWAVIFLVYLFIYLFYRIWTCNVIKTSLMFCRQIQLWMGDKLLYSGYFYPAKTQLFRSSTMQNFIIERMDHIQWFFSFTFMGTFQLIWIILNQLFYILKFYSKKKKVFKIIVIVLCK